MKFSLLAIAALPALALAQESFDSTSTITTTMMKTKTVKLSLATGASSSASDDSSSTLSKTTVAAPFPTGTGSGPFTRPSGTGVASHSFKPTVVPSGSSPVVTKGPESAGMSLDAGRVVFGGVAAMLVVAML